MSSSYAHLLGWGIGIQAIRGKPEQVWRLSVIEPFSAIIAVKLLVPLEVTSSYGLAGKFS